MKRPWWERVVLVNRRNPLFKWFAIAPLAMLGLVYLPTPLRGNFWKALDSKYRGGSIGRLVMGRIEANRNDDKTISLELNQDETRKLLAKAAGLPLWRMDDLFISIKSDWWDASRPEPARLVPSLDAYVGSRLSGHTPQYAQAVLQTIGTKPPADLAFLTDLRDTDVIPHAYVSGIEKTTDADGTSHIHFVVIDGEVAWTHYLSYKKSGEESSSFSSREDAMDHIPKFATLMNEAKQVVEATMKQQGISGLGSCHTYWQLKKEYLKAKGYDWKSPSELNPGAIFD